MYSFYDWIHEKRLMCRKTDKSTNHPSNIHTHTHTHVFTNRMYLRNWKDLVQGLNSYVIERKRSGKLRICLDPKPLNKALINNNHCQVSSLESITHRFANKNAIKFSKLDVRSGYWHCKLNDKARELTAFGTPQGNYRYKRLPMGITPASKAFQTKMIKQFQGINGVSIIQDD